MSADLAAMLLLISATTATRPLTLQETVLNGYQNSNDVSDQREKLREAISHVRKAISAIEPTISVQADLTNGRDTVTGGTPLENSLLRSSVPRSSYDVVLDQPIFLGGRSVPEIESAIDSVRAEEYRLESIEESAIQQAVQDYLDCYRDSQDVNISTEIVTVNEKILAGYQALQTAGNATRIDVLNASAQLAEAKVDLQQEEERQIKDTAAFQKDVGIPVGRLAEPDLKAPNLQSVMDVDSAASQSPDVLGAQYDDRAADHQIDVARSYGRPSVELEGAYRKRDGAVFPEERETVRSLSLTAKIPLFSGGAVKADVEEKTAQSAEARIALQTAERKARADAESYFGEVGESREIVTQYHQAYLDNETIYAGEKRMQSLGQAEEEDILTSRNQMLNALRHETDARHDYLTYVIDLRRALGLLRLSDFKIGLSDPDLYTPTKKLIWQGISLPFIK